MILYDSENLANCSYICWRTLHSFENIAFIFFRACPVFWAVIYTGNISVAFEIQGIFLNFDPEYIFIWFIKYGYYFVEFVAEVNLNPPLPLPWWAAFFVLLFLKTKLHKYLFGWFKLFMFSLRSLSYLFISPLKASSDIFSSERPFMFQNPVYSPDSIWILSY